MCHKLLQWSPLVLRVSTLAVKLVLVKTDLISLFILRQTFYCSGIINPCCSANLYNRSYCSAVDNFEIVYIALQLHSSHEQFVHPSVCLSNTRIVTKWNTLLPTLLCQRLMHLVLQHEEWLLRFGALHAFHVAWGEQRTMPLSPQRGLKNVNWPFFVEKWTVKESLLQSFLCTNFKCIVARHSLAYLTLYKWLVGDVIFYLKFWSKVTPFKNGDFQSIFTHSTSAITHSKMCSVITNKKSTTGFPVSLRWTAYVPPKSHPAVWSHCNSRVTCMFYKRSTCY